MQYKPKQTTSKQKYKKIENKYVPEVLKGFHNFFAKKQAFPKEFQCFGVL